MPEEVTREVLDNEVRFYLIERLDTVRTIIDIGAHIGAFADYAHILYPSADIQCYEPDPDNYSKLEINWPTALPLAVYSHDGQIPFINTANDESKVDWFNEGRISVPCVSLSTVLRDYPHDVDILKVDCEGSEFQIFLSAEESDIRKIRYITMEFHDWRGVDERQKLMDKIGETHRILVLDRTPFNAIWHAYRK